MTVGRHVRARRDLTTGFFGGGTVRSGTRGLIVAVERGGLFSPDRYVVEFAAGLGSVTMRVRSTDVDLLWSGGGAAGWRRRRELERGVRLGVFLAFGVPTLISLALYLVRGGTLAGLIAALPGELVGFAVSIGVVPVLTVVAAILLIRLARGGGGG